MRISKLGTVFALGFALGMAFSALIVGLVG